MDKNLGVFTCYGIEYVFDYLGEGRIRQKIEELENKPTASMGLSLEDFTYGNSDFSYFNGKGVLWVFNLLLQWFDDIEFVQFLYENSKKYNEDNYHDSSLLKKKWYDYNERMNDIIKINPEESAKYEANKLNPYWLEYHFFYMQLSKLITKAFENKKNIDLDLVGFYEFENNKLTGKVLLEFKTRRKPLTGQYLMYREGLTWYDLEPIEISSSLQIYHFVKEKNLYSLKLEKDKLSASIDLLKSNPESYRFNSMFQKSNLEQLWVELIDNYIDNFNKISLRMKQDCLLYPNTFLSNGMMWNIYDFYEQKNEHGKASEIAKVNNAYLDVWNEIPEYDEEENVE